MKFSHTLKTTASPEAIWTVWTDVGRWPEWDSELVSSTLEGAFQLGATGTLIPKQGPSSRFVISQVSWGECYTFTTKLPLCNLHVRRYLQRDQGSLLFTHEVSFEGPLAIVFSRVLGKRFESVLPSVMVAMNQIAEARD